MNTRELPPLVAIAGPTAVGKTALSIRLAQQLGGEIVNADSRQIYRHMDIGTAKPTRQDQAAVPHHLIDIVDPDEPFSLALYQELAFDVIQKIQARGKLPLLVGGTGQYLAAVLEGWSIPRVPPQSDLRARLTAEAASKGIVVLYERLLAIDPAAAAKIESNNLRRIIRALEVHDVTGKPISEQQIRQPPPYHIRTLWLTIDRTALYKRIDARVDAMIVAGLIDEVRSLLRQGYSWDLPALSSLGYKEFRPYFEGTVSLEECIERLKFNSHAFVRKQDMWFRRLPNSVRIDAGRDDVVEQSLAALDIELTNDQRPTIE